MFSKKKTPAPPPMMSLEDIEADLASFSTQQSLHNSFNFATKQLIDEILSEKSENENAEIDDLTWWKLFKVFQNQFLEIEERAKNIKEMKTVIESQKEELKEKRDLLETEIEELYHIVLKLKTPE